MMSPRKPEIAMTGKIALLLALVAVIVFSPLLLKSGREFAGTDESAKNIISEINKDYSPWFSPLWEPPGKEIESLIFTLQAVIGSSGIAFYLGYLAGKKNSGK